MATLIGRDVLPALKVIFIASVADPIGFRSTGIEPWTLLVNDMHYYFKLTGRGICAYLCYGVDINPEIPRVNPYCNFFYLHSLEQPWVFCDFPAQQASSSLVQLHPFSPPI